MATAAELGLTQEEFERAVNLERIYSLVNKSECAECGKTPVTHGETVTHILLCNNCGKKNSSAKKIATTDFSTSDINKFESKAGGKAPARKSSFKENPKHKKTKKKRQHLPSSSSSISESPESSSSSEIQYQKKQKKPKKSKVSSHYSPPPATYADPVNPPSAFPGAHHQSAGMNTIKLAEHQQLMMQQQQRHPSVHPQQQQLAMLPSLSPVITPPLPQWAIQANQPIPCMITTPPRHSPISNIRPQYPMTYYGQMNSAPRMINPNMQNEMITPPWQHPPPMSSNATFQHSYNLPSSYSMATPPRYPMDQYRRANDNNPFRPNAVTQSPISKYPWNQPKTARTFGSPMLHSPMLPSSPFMHY